MSEIKLLPCPFCGGVAEEQATVVNDVFMHEVVCKDCGFESKVQTAETPGQAREKAIAAWNQRKPMEKILEQLDILNDLAIDQYNKSQAGTYVHDFADGKSCGIELAMDIIKEEGGLND